MFERLLKAINNFFGTTFDENSNNLTEVATYLESAQKPNELIEQNLNSLSDKISSLGAKLDESNQIIKELNEKNEKLSAKVDELKTQNDKLIEESKRLTDDNSRLAAEINTLKQGNYNVGGSTQQIPTPSQATANQRGGSTIDKLVLTFN